MFLFVPLIIGTKAERFNLFQNCLKSNRSGFSDFFKFKNETRTKPNLFYYRIETFP
jgi:hypothetical protein